MANRRKKVKEEVWVGVIVGVIVVYALLADWWKTHAVLGWVILAITLAIAGYVFYRYASVRGWLGRQAKDVVQKVVFDKVASDREPLPQATRAEILKRAQNRCEYELCHNTGKPHIHHIDMDNSNNRLVNLIGLCPNCHQKAHDGKFSQSQLFNWARRDYKKLQARKSQR